MIDFKILENISKSNNSIKSTKDGFWTIVDNNVYIHSLYSPYKEAEKYINNLLEYDREKTLVILFGVGLGYVLDLLEKENFKNVVVIERSSNVYSIFNKVYKNEKNYYIIGPEDNVEKIDSIFSTINFNYIRDIKTIILRSTYKKEFYKDFEDRIEKLLKIKLGDFTTRLKFEELWFINIVRNITNIFDSGFVSSLFNLFAKKPVLIISAGPSLSKSLDIIKKVKDYFIIVAVDTALLPLYEAGITPDFLFSLDSQVYNIKDFIFINRNYLENINLVYDFVINSKIPKLFKKKFISNTAHLDFDFQGNPFLIKSDIVNWIEQILNIKIGDIETGGSVSTSALHFAYMIGGEPIVLIGQDLTYTYYSTHSSSSSHYYTLLKKSNRLNPIGSQFLDIINKRKCLNIKSLDNENYIITDFILNNYKNWFEESAKNINKIYNNKFLFNATINGAFINNFESINLLEWFDRNKNNLEKLNKNNLININYLSNKKKVKIYNMLNNFLKFVRDIRVDRELFSYLKKSEWYFLETYFLKEKIIFERYDNFDKLNIERKKYRLIKNLEGMIYGAGKIDG